MQPLVCPTCSAPASNTDVLCANCATALPGRGAARAGMPKWAWIVIGVGAGCLVLLVVAGVLASIFVPRLLDGSRREREALIQRALAEAETDSLVQADIEELTNALNEFSLRNSGSYPAALEVLWMPDANGARYIERDAAPVDVWGNAYEYRLPGPDDVEPLVFSKGPDGVADTADDVYAVDAENEDDSEPADEEEPVDDGSPR